MKKKILFSFIALFIATIFVVKVNAASVINIGIDVPAKAPESIPAQGTVVHGTVSNDFDFSKVLFEDANDTTGSIPGKDDLKKIFIGKLKSTIPTSNLTLDNTFDNWFSAYCLDADKKYPATGIFSNPQYLLASNDNVDKYGQMLMNIVNAALVNDKNVQDVFDSKVTEYATISSTFDLPDGETSQSIVEKVLQYNQEVTVFVTDVSILDKNRTYVEFTGSELAKDSTKTKYELTFKGIDVLFDKFDVTNNSNITGYDHALWIIEHSYPTLPIRTALSEAGADYDTLKSEIATLDSSISTSDLDTYVENYVYATVQYAVWKSTGYKPLVEVSPNNFVKKTLGNSVKNVGELDKLYKYLIKDRDEYTGYSTLQFKNKITVKSPAEGKELVKENTTTYTYGPFSATYDVLAGGDMNVEITNDDSTGIKIVDSEGNALTKVSPKQEFYIEVLKSKKIGSISGKLTLADASMFDPLTNRGRIYYPFHTLAQNVMSGGKIVNKSINTTFNLTVNSKTGVENIALLLMVTLVAFTLGYLVLSYKSKPVSLQ